MEPSSDRATGYDAALREYADADAHLRRILDAVRRISRLLEAEGWKNVTIGGVPLAPVRGTNPPVALDSWPSAQDLTQAISRWYDAKAKFEARPVGPTGTMSDMDLSGS